MAFYFTWLPLLEKFDTAEILSDSQLQVMTCKFPPPKLYLGTHTSVAKRSCESKIKKKSQNVWIADTVFGQERKGEEIKLGLGVMPTFPMMLNEVLCHIDT